jgi:hypothetical protein
MPPPFNVVSALPMVTVLGKFFPSNSVVCASAEKQAVIINMIMNDFNAFMVFF